jgi:hypothetical protein
MGCRPDPLFVTPSALFFSPRAARRGVPRHYRGRGMTGCGDFSLRSKRQKRLSPRAYYFVAPSGSEGSPLRRRPERSEGGLGLRSEAQSRGFRPNLPSGGRLFIRIAPLFPVRQAFPIPIYFKPERMK